MVHNFIIHIALLSNLLLAYAVLASPFARLAHRRESRQSQPTNRVESRDYNDVTSPYWAGAVWVAQPETFTSVKGTFTVPTFSGSSGSGAMIWVGIDGYSCTNAILQTGVKLSISDDGTTSYSAWFEWFPGGSRPFDDPITVSAGDVIIAAVITDSTTSGLAIIENWTTGQMATQSVSSSHALCLQEAEWIVEDPLSGPAGERVPFADFGTVTFSNATASDGDNQYTPESGATVFNIAQNGNLLTSVRINEDIDGVIVKYA